MSTSADALIDGRPSDRDLHLLLPREPQRVAVVGASDVADGLRLAGHTVESYSYDDPLPTGAVDICVLVSPHRASISLRDLVAAADQATVDGGQLVVVDRPRWAWPDLLGRRDRLSGRRFTRGISSARRVRRVLESFRPIRREVIATSHDQRYRHMIVGNRDGSAPSQNALRLGFTELWSEAELPLRGMPRVLSRLPYRIVFGTAPICVWVAGGTHPLRIDELIDTSAVLFLGSRSSSAVTIVPDDVGSPRAVVVDPSPRWTPRSLVATASALQAADIEDVFVAAHELDHESVRVAWLDGRPALRTDLPRLAAAIGRLHQVSTSGTERIGETSLADGRHKLTQMLADARTVAPATLASLLDGLESVETPVSWVHGDWGLRNVRMTDHGIGVFDLEFADRSGPASFDIGWFLLREGAGPDAVKAYEEASLRTLADADLRLGLAGMLVRYGAAAASTAWENAAESGLLAAVGASVDTVAA